MNTYIDGEYMVTEFDSGHVIRELTPRQRDIVTPPLRTLTKLEYMNRFSDSELAGIYTAAKSNVAVEIWLEKFKLATDIDLDDPVTVAGLQAMESAGLLVNGRAAEIIT